MIGAGAIVNHDVASHSIVVGNPARKSRDRFEPALVEAIEATKWWELNIHELRELIVRDSDIAFAPTAATSVLGRMTTALWVKGGGPVQ